MRRETRPRFPLPGVVINWGFSDPSPCGQPRYRPLAPSPALSIQLLLAFFMISKLVLPNLIINSLLSACLGRSLIGRVPAHCANLEASWSRGCGCTAMWWLDPNAGDRSGETAVVRPCPAGSSCDLRDALSWGPFTSAAILQAHTLRRHGPGCLTPCLLLIILQGKSSTIHRLAQANCSRAGFTYSKPRPVGCRGTAPSRSSMARDDDAGRIRHLGASHRAPVAPKSPEPGSIRLCRLRLVCCLCSRWFGGRGGCVASGRRCATSKKQPSSDPGRRRLCVHDDDDDYRRETATTNTKN